jgi:hypothetical protein
MNGGTVMEREELAAEIVWRYVERLRESGRTGASRPLTREELDELVKVMETAGELTPALTAEDPEPARAAVRRRVESAMAALQAEAPPAPVFPARARPAPSMPRSRRLVPALSLAAASVLACLIATVNLWHRPDPPAAGNSPAPASSIVDVPALDEATAHNWIPRLVENSLNPEETRRLLWHMLKCPACFNEWWRQQSRRKTAALPRETRIAALP